MPRIMVKHHHFSLNNIVPEVFLSDTNLTHMFFLEKGGFLLSLIQINHTRSVFF